MVLDGYPVGLAVALKTLETTCDWWEWFAEALSSHSKMLLEKACNRTSCTSKVRAQCWHRAMGGLKSFFDELRKVRVHASGAEFHTNIARKHGMFLHCTLQALRIMQEFREADFERHKSVQDGMLEHIYETYQPRDSSDVTPRVRALETKVDAQAVTIGQQRGDINRLKGGRGSGNP